MNVQKIKQLEDLKRKYGVAFDNYVHRAGGTRKEQLQDVASAFVAFFKKESFTVQTHQNDCSATYGTFRVRLSLASNPMDSRPISIEISYDYSSISLYQIDLGSSLDTTDYYPPDTENIDEKVASEIELLTSNITLIKEWESANNFPDTFFWVVAVAAKNKVKDDSYFPTNVPVDVPEELRDKQFGNFNDLLSALFLNENAH